MQSKLLKPFGSAPCVGSFEIGSIGCQNRYLQLPQPCRPFHYHMSHYIRNSLKLLRYTRFEIDPNSNRMNFTKYRTSLVNITSDELSNDILYASVSQIVP